MSRLPIDGRRIRVARRVPTEFGVPGCLIDNRLALELKVGDHEGREDALIGQCCKYSVEWCDLGVVIGMSSENVKACELLAKKSLHYIEVVDFDLIEQDDDEEDD